MYHFTGFFVQFVLLALPAHAHPGQHLHPHGAGHWLTLVLAFGLLAVAAAIWLRRK